MCWYDIFPCRPDKGLFRPTKGPLRPTKDLFKLKRAIGQSERALCWSGKPFVRLRQGSVKAGACPLCRKQSPSAGVMKASRKTSLFFRICGSPDGTDIMTVFPGDITHSLVVNGREQQEAAAAVCVMSAHAHSDLELIRWHKSIFM